MYGMHLEVPTVVSEFPNFFILYGPNAATGQHSVIFHSECQINFSCRLLRPVLKGNTDSIAVKPKAQKRDLAWVHGKLQYLVFNSGCTSWWMDPVTKKNTIFLKVVLSFILIQCTNTGFALYFPSGPISL